MKIEKVAKKLGSVYGYCVQIKTPWHIRVVTSENSHDVWVLSGGSLKYKRDGDTAVHENCSLEFITSKIGSHKKLS